MYKTLSGREKEMNYDPFGFRYQELYFENYSIIYLLTFTVLIFTLRC